MASDLDSATLTSLDVSVSLGSRNPPPAANVLGGAGLAVCATGLGSTGSGQMHGLPALCPPPQTFLEITRAGTVKPLWWVFVVVLLFIALLRMQVGVLQQRYHCHTLSGHPCRDGWVGHGDRVWSASVDPDHLSRTLYVIVTAWEGGQVGKPGELEVTSTVCGEDGECSSENLSVAVEGCGGVRDRWSGGGVVGGGGGGARGSGGGVVGWMWAHQKYTIEVAPQGVHAPCYGVVLLSENPQWVLAECIIRYIFTAVSVVCCVLLCCTLRRLHHGPLVGGQPGAGGALVVWSVVLLLGFIVYLNPFLPMALFSSTGRRFAEAVEHSTRDVYYYTYIAFSLAVVLVAWYGTQSRPTSPALPHALVSLYLSGSLAIHAVTATTMSHRPFASTYHHPEAFGIPTPDEVVLALAAVWHGTWGLFALVRFVKLNQRLGTVAFSPYSCPFLLTRWFVWFGVPHFIVECAIHVSTAVQSDVFIALSPPSIGAVLGAGLFVGLMVYAVWPVTDREHKKLQHAMPPVTPLHSWRRVGWEEREVLELERYRPVGDQLYFFAMEEQASRWRAQCQYPGRLPPLFCLELADWLWAVSWEVTASDPLLFFYWRPISSCEAAALGAVPRHFRFYASRYVDYSATWSDRARECMGFGLRAKPAAWYKGHNIMLAPRYTERPAFGGELRKGSIGMEHQGMFCHMLTVAKKHEVDVVGFDFKHGALSFSDVQPPCSPALSPSSATRWDPDDAFRLSSPGKILPPRPHLDSPRSPMSPGTASTTTWRRASRGQLEEVRGLEPPDMRGVMKASFLMNWHPLGLPFLLPVVCRNHNQATVTLASNCIVVSFRGTLNLDNVQSDLKACMTPAPRGDEDDVLSLAVHQQARTELHPPQGHGEEKMKLHSGFLEIWVGSLRRHILGQIVRSMVAEDDLPSRSPLCGIPFRPVYITGHSLGGALATLCAYDVASTVVPRVDFFLHAERKRRWELAVDEYWSWCELVRAERSGLCDLRTAHEPFAEGVDELVQCEAGRRGVIEDSQLRCAMRIISRAFRERRYPVVPPHRELVVYTYGSPRVGNKAWKERYNRKVPHTFRIVNGQDLVPHLPPSNLLLGWSHVGKLVKISKMGDLRIDPPFAERKLADTPFLPGSRTLHDHRMGEYRQALASVAYAHGLARAVKFVDRFERRNGKKGGNKEKDGDQDVLSAGEAALDQLLRHQRGEDGEVPVRSSPCMFEGHRLPSYPDLLARPRLAVQRGETFLNSTTPVKESP